MKQTFIFVSPSFLEKMRNGTHFNFMSYIQDMIQDYSTENTKFLAYLKEFNDALAKEDNFLVITRKSDFTVSIHEADTMRDSLSTIASNTLYWPAVPCHNCRSTKLQCVSRSK